MSKNTANPFEIAVEYIMEDKFVKECNKFGIEYQKPSFIPMNGIDDDNSIICASWFYLESDVNDKPDFMQAIKDYNRYLASDNTIRNTMKFLKANRILKKMERKYFVKPYTVSQKEKYLNNYKKEKEVELNKAKAIVKVAKEEMKLEK